MSTNAVNAPASVKIFGREPAVAVGVLEAAVTFLLAFGLGVSQTSYGPIIAAVSALAGLYVAYATKDTLLGALIGVVKAGVVLGAVYGLTLSDQQTAAIIGLVTMLVTFYQRTQTSPVAFPTAPSPAPVTVQPAPDEELVIDHDSLEGSQ